MTAENDTVATEWREKTEKMKKIQFLRELDQIKLQRHGIERERTGFMYEKRDKQYAHLEEIEKSLSEELKTERLKIEQQLKKIRNKVNQFQRELKRVKPTPEFVERLKVVMETIETTIGEFKQKQREVFENLMISEKETEQEIAALEGKIKVLLEGGGSTARNVRNAKSTIKTQNNNIPKEVHNFETFVAQTGGMQGGWDDYDHGTFLRLRDKFHGNKNFIQAAVRQIPGRTEDDIAEHEKWYSCFLDLKKRKKDAITSWRKEKEEKDNRKDSAEEEPNPETERMKKEKEEALQKRLHEEREAKKEEVQKWKMKRQEHLRAEEEKRADEERRKKLLEQRKKIEMEAARDAARQILKERREDEERMRWMREIEAEQIEIERQQEVKERISQFQTRDRMSLKLKQIEQRRKDEAERERKEKLEKIKLKVHVDRDPSRLYQLTEGWVNRTRSSQDAGGGGSAMPIKMPHRYANRATQIARICGFHDRGVRKMALPVIPAAP